MLLLHQHLVVVQLALLSMAAPASTTIRLNVDWDAQHAVTAQAIPTFANVVSPSMDRTSPIHDRVFGRINKLGATLSRYLHWSQSQAPFPEPVEGVFNFTLVDQYVLDYMACKNAESAVINFDAGPCWLHTGTNCSKPLRDPTGKEYGEWVSRILGWYTKGGFTDTRTGKVYTSGHYLQWQHYEVLNEPNLDGWMYDAIGANNTKPVPPYVRYTELYDGIVGVLHRDHPDLKIVGLCAAQRCDGCADDIYDDGWFTYFFNASNHQHGIAPPQYVTYHFYAIPGALGSVDPWPTLATDHVSAWPIHLFRQAAQFIKRAEHVNHIIRAGTFGGAHVKIFQDEVGIIGGDHCPVGTLFGSDKEYWNIAASLWGFYYGELARLGSAAIAASQLIGYPAGVWNIHGQPVRRNFPCVSLMDWRGNGSDTARTWALQMTIDVLGNGEKNVFPVTAVHDHPGGDRNHTAAGRVDTADHDSRVHTTTGAGYDHGPTHAAHSADAALPPWPLPSTVYSIGLQLDTGNRVVLISNTNSSAASVTVRGAAGSKMHTVDARAGYGDVPYKTTKLASDNIPLAASAFVLLELA